jgi:chromate transport protein ChrA
LVLSCLRAVVLGLIAATAIDFGREALLAESGVFGGVSLGGLLVSWPAAIIAAGTFLALRFRKAGPVLCIALSGAAGALVLR